MFRHPCKPLTKVEHWGMTFSERFCKNFPQLTGSAAQESVSEQSIDDSIKTFLPVCLYLHFCIGNSSVWTYVCLCLCRRLYKVFFLLYAKFNFYCFCTWTSDIATDVYEWFNPIYPRGGGTLCPPCYVFAYNCANTRTSPLKKLDFSQLWVWKRVVLGKFISFRW